MKMKKDQKSAGGKKMTDPRKAQRDAMLKAEQEKKDNDAKIKKENESIKGEIKDIKVVINRVKTRCGLGIRKLFGLMGANLVDLEGLEEVVTQSGSIVNEKDL